MSYIGVANSGEILFTTDDVQSHTFGQLQGDAAGLIHDITVSGIVGYPIAAGPPASGNILLFNGAEWSFATDSASVHNLLDGVTHPDTAVASPTQGDLIFGNGSSLWDALSLGLDGEVLYSNGTDVTYTILGASTPFDLGGIGAPSIAFSGDPDTGLSWGGADTLNASAGATLLFQLSGASGNILLNGGIVHKLTTTAINTTLGNDDSHVLVTAASVDITLPPSPDPGQKVVIKDRDGLANGAANQISILGNGNNIDGNTEIRIRNRYGAFALVYNGAGEWNVL